MIEKIISGGQDGADLGGLDAAQVADIPTGGMMPRGWLTESGPKPSYKEKYGMTESSSSAYPPRTWANVYGAEGTAIFSDDLKSTGTLQTIAAAKSKPMIINPTAEDLATFVRTYDIEILNIAGNRASKAPGVYQRTYDVVLSAIMILKGEA